MVLGQMAETRTDLASSKSARVTYRILLNTTAVTACPGASCTGAPQSAESSSLRCLRALKSTTLALAIK